jgi:membrane protease YdiL (CAAX protease family)
MSGDDSMGGGGRAPTGRLAVYLATAFAITWACWWYLAHAVPANGKVMTDARFATLFLLGGFGPTIAAFVAVRATPREGSLAEYLSRVLRWRVNPAWYAVALFLPPALAIGVEFIDAVLGAHAILIPTLNGLLQIPILFPMMIIGGGLEELGWRGVAQPSLSKRMGLLRACLIVGAIWALWHLPLFYIPSVSQYGSSFPIFALGAVANALLLGWLYARTESILLCVLFHAASNTSATLGLDLTETVTFGAWIAVSAKAIMGLVLILTTPKPPPTRFPAFIR